MSSLGALRFLLYALTAFFAAISSIYLFFVSFMYDFLVRFFGLDVFFGLAVLFSCAHHWKQQSKKAKTLTNLGRIFFWSSVVTRMTMAFLFVLAFTGTSSSWMH